MKKLVFFALLMLTPLIKSVYANEDLQSTTIEWISVYTEYGNGDVGFLTKDKGTICYGYWLSGDAPGFQQTYSMLLSAYHSNSSIDINVSFSDSTKWPASSNHYCKLIRVALSAN